MGFGTPANGSAGSDVHFSSPKRSSPLSLYLIKASSPKLERMPLNDPIYNSPPQNPARFVVKDGQLRPIPQLQLIQYRAEVIAHRAPRSNTAGRRSPGCSVPLATSAISSSSRALSPYWLNSFVRPGPSARAIWSQSHRRTHSALSARRAAQVRCLKFLLENIPLSPQADGAHDVLVI